MSRPRTLTCLAVAALLLFLGFNWWLNNTGEASPRRWHLLRSSSKVLYSASEGDWDWEERPRADPMFNPILSLPVRHNQTRILLVSYFRSGSTFLGELLQQNWPTFYHFEPLHFNGSSDQQLLRDLWDCHFPPDYVMWASQEENAFLFRKNRFLAATCRFRPESCEIPAFLREVCLRGRIHLTKTTRLSLSRALELVNPGTKVVHLVRDPRAIMQSRQSLPWCRAACLDPACLCTSLRSDLAIHRGVYRLRYEDLVDQPELQARKLFKWAGLDFSKEVRDLLKSHTDGSQAQDGDPYSTWRNASAAAYRWREAMTSEKKEAVQRVCQDVLGLLNYSKR